MECCLHQAHAREMLFSDAVHDRFHQLAARSAVLCGGIDCDRANACNYGALVHAIAANNLPLLLGHHTKESRMFEHERHDFGCNIWRWEVGRKIVVLVEGSERFVTDAAARFNIGRLCATNSHSLNSSLCRG